LLGISLVANDVGWTSFGAVAGHLYFFFKEIFIQIVFLKLEYLSFYCWTVRGFFSFFKNKLWI
jgi:hypothetical protein